MSDKAYFAAIVGTPVGVALVAVVCFGDISIAEYLEYWTSPIFWGPLLMAVPFVAVFMGACGAQERKADADPSSRCVEE